MGCKNSKHADQPKLRTVSYDKQGTQGQQDYDKKQQNNPSLLQPDQLHPHESPIHKKNIMVEQSFQQTAPPSNSTNRDVWKLDFNVEKEKKDPPKTDQKKVELPKNQEPQDILQQEIPKKKEVPELTYEKEIFQTFSGENKFSPEIKKNDFQPIKQMGFTSPKKVNLLDMLKKKPVETPQSKQSKQKVNILKMLQDKKKQQETKKSIMLPPPMFYEESRQDISPIYADYSKEKKNSLRPFENDATQEKSFLFPNDNIDDLSRLQLRVETLNVSYQESPSGSKVSQEKQFFLNLPDKDLDVNQSVLTPTYAPLLDQKSVHFNEPTQKQDQKGDERCASFCVADSNQFVPQDKKPPTKHILQHRATIETSFLERSKDESGKKKLNHYVILHELGRGGFGKVKLVYNQIDSQYYAMKQANKSKLKKKMLTRTKSVYTLLEQEIAIMKKVDHPNVVKLYEVIDDPDEDKLYMIMEYVKKGEVKQEMISKYLRDFLFGLNYLHNYCRIIHRDIKPDNLLIDCEGNLKIADFGVAKILDDTDIIEDDSGTKAFLTPEFFQGKQVKGKSADIWATGITFYKLAFDKMPFMAPRLEELKQAIITQEVKFPEDSDPQLVDLIKCCLEKNPQKRIQLEELMQHPFVTDNGNNLLTEQDYDDKMILFDQEIRKAITKLTLRASVIITAKLKKQLKLSRQRIKSRTQDGDIK